MGLINNFIFNSIKQKEDNFTKIIRAYDNGETWAQKEFNNLLKNGDQNILYQIDSIRQKIYANDAKKNDPKAMFYYGISSHDFNTFMRMLVPLAEQGNVDAIIAIASEYSLGTITSSNAEESFKWYLKAARLGDVSSQNIVALSYTCNDGCGEINYDKAFHWYSASAKQNNASGYCGMATCYEHWQDELVFPLHEATSVLHQRNYSDINDASLKYDEKRIDCYETARNFISNNDEAIETFYGLAKSYASASKHLSNQSNIQMAQKLAIYYYYVAHDCGHPYGLKYAKEIADNNNIYVNFYNIDDWAEKEGIITSEHVEN